VATAILDKLLLPSITELVQNRAQNEPPGNLGHAIDEECKTKFVFQTGSNYEPSHFDQIKKGGEPNS
jgi:hypothetical protein